MWRRLQAKVFILASLRRTHPITPLFASKSVNVCTYFRHLCIIEKRRPLAELLVSYGGRYCAAHGQRCESPLLCDNVSYRRKLIRCEQHLRRATQLVITLILSMVCRIYGRLRLTGSPALHHASRHTRTSGANIAGPTSPTVKILCAYCFVERHMTPQNFQVGISKTIWKQFAPWGPTPKFVGN